jgi:Zn-dependent protease with chaperone function
VILAHELAHHVHRDLWRGIALQSLILVGGFFVADIILRAAAVRWRCAASPIPPACRC